MEDALELFQALLDGVITIASYEEAAMDCLFVQRVPVRVDGTIWLWSSWVGNTVRGEVLGRIGKLPCAEERVTQIVIDPELEGNA